MRYNRQRLTIRRWLLKVLFPITQFVGKLHWPFTHKRMQGEDYFSIEKILKPGMAFLTRTNGEISNVVNPGFWKHGAIYVGDGIVVEAVGAGVVKTNIISFLLKKDYVAVMKPLFADEEAMAKAAKQALEWVGRPYDFSFELWDKAFYCYEVIYRAYKVIMHSLGQEMPFEIKTISLGVPTIIGEDFYKATEKWQCLWENRS